jgi:predicted transcriptional regulator
LTKPITDGTTCTVTTRKANVRPPLTELENEVMSAVWRAGPSSVETVHKAVSPKRALKEVTIRTLLRRLEQKGYLRHRVEGRAYIYSATEPASSLAARAVRQIIDRLCQGSVEELVSGMVEAKVLTNRELDRLGEVIRKRREGGE